MGSCAEVALRVSSLTALIFCSFMCMVKSTMALASPELALSSAPRFGLAGRPFSNRVACCTAASSSAFAFAFAAASTSVVCIAASCAGEGEGAG